MEHGPWGVNTDEADIGWCSDDSHGIFAYTRSSCSNEALLEQVLFWLAGSVSGRSLDNLVAVFPYLAVGWVLALIISGKMNVLSMGEDVAKGLGLNIVFLKLVLGLVVILLAGGSVAVAGPIGFIGIVVPHLTRSIVGIDHRWLIPFLDF